MINIDELQTEFEDASPQKTLKWATRIFGEELVVVTSFQMTGVVILHMLQDIAPTTKIITLDTGFLFPETVQLIDQLEHDWQLNLSRITPNFDEKKQYRDMWHTNPKLCCQMRKVEPLNRELKHYSAWISGLRRDQSSTRQNISTIGYDPKREGLIKINPFAKWTGEMIKTYVKSHELPYNILYDQGYLSIGCYPCTRPVQEGEDPRAGRWSDNEKIECGIHVD